MIFKVFIFFSYFLPCLCGHGHPPKPPKCLSGYMTDVQNWVDENGRLIPKPGDSDNVIDLSTTTNPVQVLNEKMNLFRRRRTVRYLSLAKCQLTRVPPIFQLRDNEMRPLAMMLEYMTLFGNNFLGMSTAGEHYTLSFNATGTTVMNLSNSPQRQVVSVWSSGFTAVNFPNLKELDLRSCSIQTLEKNLFRGMPNLTALYIGENEIHFISSSAFYGLRNLVHLDFSRNEAFDENGNPKNLATDDYLVFNYLESLVSLDLSHTKLTLRNLGMLKSLGKSVRSLSLCDTGLTVLQDGIFNSTSLHVLDLSRNSGILNNQRPLRGLEDTLLALYAREVNLQRIDQFQNFSNLLVLQLAGNEINTVDLETIRTLKALKVLNLNKNRLNSWFEPTFSLLPNLHLLSLQDNNINVITEQMIADLINVNYLALSGNFMVCNCHAKDLYKMAAKNEKNNTEDFIDLPEELLHRNIYSYYNDLIQNRSKVGLEDCEELCFDDIGHSGSFRLLDYYPEAYVCLQVPESKTIFISDVYSCGRLAREINYEQELNGSRKKLLALLIIPCVLLPVALIFVFRRRIKYFFITMRNSAMLSLINKKDAVDGKNNTIFNYDVFVSYCNEDRGWVLDHLLPHMEAECSISACLHERDFLVGLSILENIVSCMDRSRSIMLILSQRFLLSQWCQFEMHLAQHRLLETRREDLTLILLEDIPRRLRPNTLHYLMMTKTYIVWPKDESERPIFWKRLKKTLIAQKNKPTENASLA
nr:toll-like receptor 13 isoform X1 [Helicoverpa armigera]